MKVNWSYLPNLITSIRFLLIYPILQALFADNNLLAFCLLLIAGFSDALDGQLARSYGWESQIGAFLDPLADKILLISVFGTLSYLSKLPWQLGAIFIGRDILIMLGIIVYRIYIGPMTYQAVLMSKINTVLQFLLILCLTIPNIVVTRVIEHLPQVNPDTPAAFSYLIMIAATITSLVSAVQYMVIWGSTVWKYVDVRKQ